MALITADSLGIDSTGATDVRVAIASGFNACAPGDTFQLHANGLYLTHYYMPLTLTAPGVTFDGNGATIFRNQRRGPRILPGEDIFQVAGNDITVQDLNIYGFRKDVYTGEKLTTVVGTPTIVGTTVEMTTANDEVRLPLVGLDQVGNPKVSTNFETPYYFRQVDGLTKFEASMAATGGSGPAEFCIYDDDTDVLLHSESFDPTGGAPQTFTITFDPGTTHLGTRFRITIKKVVTGGTLTVHSITPYGECGFRRDDTTWFTGGDEFSDAFAILATTGVTIKDCHAEGPDGDGFNCQTTDSNTTFQRLTVRGNGRQGYTLHRSVNLLVEDCLAREVGRSGIDYEPNNVHHVMLGTLMRRCEFINVRNYGVAIRHWAKNVNAVMEDVTTTNCGMGGFDGGGRPMTIERFFHSGTYRTDADRVLNGGHTGVDMEIHGIDMTVDDVSTTRGIALPDLTNRSSYPGGGTANIVEYHPHDITVTNAVVDDPISDPFVFIEVPGSSVEVVDGGGGSTDPGPMWDDARYTWDDMFVTWDGRLSGTSAAPAFQLDAFQLDAYQMGDLVAGDLEQTAPAFTQALVGLSAKLAEIAQTAAAFTQTLEADVLLPAVIAQTAGAFSQAAEATLTVKGSIGRRVQTFQDDAFQDDAFQVQADQGIDHPAFTQHLTGAVVTAGSTIGIIHQQAAAFTQALDATVAFSVTITQNAPAFTQALEGFQPPAGAINQTAPHFLQALLGNLLISPEGIITQTAPAFTQSLNGEQDKWTEWPVLVGDEWLVSNDDEWLVKR